MTTWSLSKVCNFSSTFKNKCNRENHCQQKTKKKHNISINAEKSSCKIQHLFMIKTVQETENRRKFP